MKESRFNFIFEHQNQHVVYNTFSKAIAILDESELSFLHNVEESNIPNKKSLIEQYASLGFLVPDDFDENTFLKYFHYKAKFDSSHVSLTIAPTLSCNFACPYCYENAREGKMTEETQKHLLEYIEKRILAGTKSVEITWYGGEPLLCERIIDSMASSLKAMAEKHAVELGMNMVTNGFLLSEETVDMLLRNNILSVQITLDGLAENHDKRRFLRNGNGTFDQIFSNLAFFKGTPIRVNIRMNVDNHNKDDYPKLKRMVDSLSDIEIAVYPAAVEQLNDRDHDRKDYYMSSTEYDGFILDSYSSNDLYDGGLSVIDDRRYFCAAELENSYVVDEKGNFYKCWDEIGNPDRICFNVNDLDHVAYTPIMQFVCDDPFSDACCSACKFLPLCFGGCRFQKHLRGRRSCPFTNETLASFLAAKYLCADR